MLHPYKSSKLKFLRLKELSSKDWSSVTEHSDADGAYSVFVEELTNSIISTSFS